MRAAVFFYNTAGEFFTIVKEKLNQFFPAVFSCEKTFPHGSSCPTGPRLTSHASGSCRVRGYPLRHEASAGEKAFFSAYLSHFTEKNSGQFPGYGLFRSSGRKKNGRRRELLSSVRGNFQKMVRPGGVEPSTKSLEGSCSIQLSYGRTAVRLLTIDTVLRSVSRAQAGCGTAPGAVQDRRKKG